MASKFKGVSDDARTPDGKTVTYLNEVDVAEQKRVLAPFLDSLMARKTKTGKTTSLLGKTQDTLPINKLVFGEFDASGKMTTPPDPAFAKYQDAIDILPAKDWTMGVNKLWIQDAVHDHHVQLITRPVKESTFGTQDFVSTPTPHMVPLGTDESGLPIVNRNITHMELEEATAIQHLTNQDGTISKDPNDFGGVFIGGLLVKLPKGTTIKPEDVDHIDGVCYLIKCYTETLGGETRVTEAVVPPTGTLRRLKRQGSSFSDVKATQGDAKVRQDTMRVKKVTTRPSLPSFSEEPAATTQAPAARAQSAPAALP